MVQSLGSGIRPAELEPTTNWLCDLSQVTHPS